MPLWIPLAVAGAQIVSNIAGNIAAKRTAARNTNLTIAENKLQAEKAYQEQQKQVSEMNKYNSPSQQMKRFKEAGLAPQLIYSQGNPGNQSRIAEYQAPKTDYNYQAGWKGDALAPLSNLSTIVEDLRIKINEGNITGAKAIQEKAIAEFARTMELNKLKISNINLKKADQEYQFNFQEFSQFFRPSEEPNQVGGPSWEVIPGQKENLIRYVMSKYLMPQTKLAEANYDLALKEMEIKYQEDYKKLGLTMPWLKPVLDFLGQILLRKIR